MIPILPANDVSIVLAFLVSRLFSESESAVKKFIEVLSFFLSALAAFLASFLLISGFFSGSGHS